LTQHPKNRYLPDTAAAAATFVSAAKFYAYFSAADFAGQTTKTNSVKALKAAK